MPGTVSQPWLRHDSEMGHRIREHDWSATPLGPLEQWPVALRSALTLVLGHPLPMAVAWGPNLVTIYNDAYRPLLGQKPEALGRPFLDVWEEVRDIIAPQIAEALSGQTVRFENARFMLVRDGALREAWFDYSLSSLCDEAGQVAGMLNTAFERTAGVLAEQRRSAADAELRQSDERQTFLLSFSDALREEADADAIANRAISMLAEQLELDRCYITFYREAEDAADFPYQVGNESVPSLPDRVRLSDFPDAYEQIRGRTFVINDDFERRGLSEAEKANSKALGMRAMVASTARRGGRNPLSSLVAVSASPRCWLPGEIALVEIVAERTWAAMDNARAEAAARDREEKYRTLFEAIDDGFYFAEAVFDADDRCTDILYHDENPAAQRMARAPFKTRSLSELSDYASYWRSIFGTVARTGEAQRLEHYSAADGIWYDVFIFRPARGKPNELAVRFRDITERRQTEQALRESEARNRLLVGSWAQAVWEADAEGVVVADSPSWRAYTGQTLDEWLGNGWLNAIHPDDRAFAERQWRDAIEARRLLDAEFRLSTPDGRWRWTNVRAAPVTDLDGRVKKWAGMNIDIDSRKLAEAALQESELRFREFGENSSDALWIIDAETGQLEYLSPAYERIWGESRTAVMEDISHWAKLAHPDDRDAAFEAMPHLLAGEPFQADYRIIRPDGEVRWIRDAGFPIKVDGVVKRGGGIAQDVTDLKRAEAAVRESELRLKALIQGIPQLVWRAGDPGQWTWASPQWTAYTGQSEAESHDWGWLEPLHPEDRDAARAAWDQATEQGEFQAEYRIADGNNIYRWFQTRAAPVRDKEDHIVEWLGTSTDIHDLRLLQDRQQVMVRELQHRTRNLITVVAALSKQTLKDAASLSDFDHHFGSRLSALSRVQGLLSHLSAGKRVTFDDLLGSELAALGAPDDKVTLDGPSGVRLRSTTVQTFSLALHELATNALKYGALAAPGGHLTVRWEVVSSDQDEPRLRVDWRESGVDMTQVSDGPLGGGYGRELIERALPYQLDADTTYEMTESGVHCTIDVPTSTANAGSD